MDLSHDQWGERGLGSVPPREPQAIKSTKTIVLPPEASRTWGLSSYVDRYLRLSSQHPPLTRSNERDNSTALYSEVFSNIQRNSYPAVWRHVQKCVSALSVLKTTFAASGILGFRSCHNWATDSRALKPSDCSGTEPRKAMPITPPQSEVTYTPKWAFL